MRWALWAGCVFTMTCAAPPKKAAWTFDPSPAGAATCPLIEEPGAHTVVETIGNRGGGLGVTPAQPPPEQVYEPPTSITLDRRGKRYLHLRWPLAATGVTSLFGPRPDPIDGRERFHYGVDLQASYGTVVEAVAGGTVTVAGWNEGHGRMVSIVHTDGFRSSYSHLSQVLVMVGVEVVAGQAVGLVGNSGRSTGPHLHFELTRYGAYLDPLDLLGTPVAIE